MTDNYFTAALWSHSPNCCHDQISGPTTVNACNFHEELRCSESAQERRAQNCWNTSSTCRSMSLV